MDPLKTDCGLNPYMKVPENVFQVNVLTMSLLAFIFNSLYLTLLLSQISSEN